MRQILLLVTGVLALAASSSMLKALYPDTPSDPATFDPSTGPSPVETIAQLSSGIAGVIPMIIAMIIVILVLSVFLGFGWSDSPARDPAPAPIEPAGSEDATAMLAIAYRLLRLQEDTPWPFVNKAWTFLSRAHCPGCGAAYAPKSLPVSAQ